MLQGQYLGVRRPGEAGSARGGGGILRAASLRWPRHRSLQHRCRSDSFTCERAGLSERGAQGCAVASAVRVVRAVVRARGGLKTAVRRS